MDSKDFDKLAKTDSDRAAEEVTWEELHSFNGYYGSQGKDACTEDQSDPGRLNKLTTVRILARAKVLGSAFKTDLV